MYMEEVIIIMLRTIIEIKIYIVYMQSYFEINLFAVTPQQLELKNLPQ